MPRVRLALLCAVVRSLTPPPRSGTRRTGRPSAAAVDEPRRAQPRRAVARAAQAVRKKITGRGGPYKIALLVEPTPFTHVSGYANRFKEQLKYLKEFGDDVSVATPDDKPEAPDEFLGFPIKTMRGFRFPLYAHLCLTSDWDGEAKEMCEKFKPDVIHASSPGFFALAATYIAKSLDVPLVLSYHTHLPVYAERYASWLPGARALAWQTIKAAHAFADMTLVTSPQIMAEFNDHNIKNVKVWQKGIDVDIFNPNFRDEATRKVLVPAHPDKRILLYVGRISVEKRLEDITTILRERPDTVFAVVGGGPHEDALRAHFREFGDRVNFVGVLRGEALSCAYASADLFCMPSDSETLGFVVIEAMASGLPIVAADAGGIPSIVSDGSNGLLAPPGDVRAFADGAARLLDDAALRERLTARGRSDAEGWSWRSATRNLRDEHYASAIRRHAALKKEREKGLVAGLFPRRVRLATARFAKMASFARIRFNQFMAWIGLQAYVRAYRGAGAA